MPGFDFLVSLYGVFGLFLVSWRHVLWTSVVLTLEEGPDS